MAAQGDARYRRGVVTRILTVEDISSLPPNHRLSVRRDA